jgi:hypothetical protein
MVFNLNLEINYIKSIFANEEYQLLMGERIYFSKRQMLTDIYEQLPNESKIQFIKQFPMVFELLDRTNMVCNENPLLIERKS